MPPRAGRSGAQPGPEDGRAPTKTSTARGRSSSTESETGGAPRDDRRKQILKAAVKVFAEKGYHGCRISDVAEEAGVAYGLVYHYYGNKDGLLASVFDTNWGVFAKAVADVAEAPGIGMYEKLRQIVELAFQAFEMFPLVVKVLVLEFGRNARLGEALDNPAVTGVFRSIARIFEEGRRSGELYEGIDPLAMSVIFIGTLETAFVSFVLTQQGARSTMSSGITLPQMKHTLLAMIQRALLGNLHRADRDPAPRAAG
jgi:TetR/AcrR family fatty acid metabolism transcriptional regulator